MKTKKLAATIVAFILVASPALASDGVIGEQSTGNTTLNLTVNPLALITGVPDTMTFGPFTGNGNLPLTQNVCVTTNMETPVYRVKATGDGGAGTAFTVQDGTNEIAYSVTWHTNTGGAGTDITLVAATQNVTDVTTGHDHLNECPATANASYTVEFTQADLRAAFSGSYSGTLALEIDPQ